MTDINQHDRAKLEYPYSENHASNDEEILASVLNALHHNSGIPSDHIRARVKDGRVILLGVVGQEYERTLAGQAAAEAPGVKQVENNLTLES